MMEATASQTVLHNTIYKRKKRLPLSAHDRRKPLYQAVSALLPTGNSARTAYLHCIKDGTNIDPCCGSGHILVYAFHVLMLIYEECGYTQKDATAYILKDNIFGLDIDDRAYQLAYFAVMMKARSYNRRVLSMDISPNLCAIQDSNGIPKISIENTQIKLSDTVKFDTYYLLDIFKDAKEMGSLLSVNEIDFDSIENFMQDFEKSGAENLLDLQWYNSVFIQMPYFIKQAKIMSKKYAVVCTNPPYMNKFESHLKDFVTTQYKPYSGDLFSVFMYRNFDLCKKDGYSAFMTPFVWMFIKTYENLREYIINNKSISSLIQMEYSAFEEATVPICTFVLKNAKDKQNGLYIKLSDFKGGMEVQKQKVLEALAEDNCNYFYETNAKNYAKIPGMPIAFWVSEKIIEVFTLGKKLENVAEPRKGLTSSNDAEYLRHWCEVSYSDCYFNAIGGKEAKESKKKWFPVNKGGEYRKWYGNNEFIINWENDGYSIKQYKNAAIRNTEYYFKEAISWNDITSKYVSFRYKKYGQIFNDAGPSIFGDYNTIMYILGFCNSLVARNICSLIAPTIHYGVGQIAKLPIISVENIQEPVLRLVKNNISISKTDWDSFENSWDFAVHPLVRLCHGATAEDGHETAYIEDAYNEWEFDCKQQFNQLKANEEELNSIFIEIYGLQDELTPEVEDKDVTVRKADLGRDIRSFISYAVGCMFGRYSLDVEGLAFAGGDWDKKYITTRQDNIKSTFTLPMVFTTRGITHINVNGENIPLTYVPDADNCIPITDEEYFNDDIVAKFVDFVKVLYGAETLEENLDFIANALEIKGNSSREIIRTYFLKDFYKDHVKIYKNRPIYWQFDSGKEYGFKALIYMHRYNVDTIGRVRTDYLHKVQSSIEDAIKVCDYTLASNATASDKSKAVKKKAKLVKQLAETRLYDQAIAHKALERIEIDLDDGVKVNYEKFQGIEVAREGQKSVKIDLLTKI